EQGPEDLALLMFPRLRKFPAPFALAWHRESPFAAFLAGPLLSTQGIESATSGLAFLAHGSRRPRQLHEPIGRALPAQDSTLPCRRTLRHIARELLANSHAGQPFAGTHQ